MPLLCMASAVSLMSASLTSQPKAFQSLYPMGGVSANPSSSAQARVEVPGTTTAQTSTASHLLPLIPLPLPNPQPDGLRLRNVLNLAVRCRAENVSVLAERS